MDYSGKKEKSWTGDIYTQRAMENRSTARGLIFSRKRRTGCITSKGYGYDHIIILIGVLAVYGGEGGGVSLIEVSIECTVRE